MTEPHTIGISYFARTNFRNQAVPFGIKQADRLSHLYVVGKTGTGKSTLLETLCRQDALAGRGFALLDPHGDLVERVAAAIPESRKDDLVYVNVPDASQPYGYNPLKRVRVDKIPLAVSGLMEAFNKRWPEAWGVRMEHVLRHALYALMEQDDATLPDILLMLRDKAYRKRVAANVSNGQVREFWRKEFEEYSFRYRADAIAPIQNKVGAFLADPTLYRMLTKPKQWLHFRRIMDQGKILLVNLAKGRIGEDSAALLGSLLVTTIGLAALSRADVPEAARTPFFVYLDEFQSFTTLSVATMISELRKYGLGLTFAHQHLGQLEPDVRSAILGNVGTMISFRVGPEDARLLAQEFAPKFDVFDLMNLPNHNIYLSLMIDGTPSQAFSAVTLPPEDEKTISTIP